MYLGRVVEIAPTAELFAPPNHPYTQALLAEVGRVEPKKRTYVPIKGEIPSPLDPPSGCHFHPRCPFVMPRCRDSAPPLFDVGPGRTSACWLSGRVPADAGSRGRCLQVPHSVCDNVRRDGPCRRVVRRHNGPRIKEES